MHPLESDHPRSLLTRASLLFRLRDWKDGASWEEFYQLYRKLVYGLARNGGLAHDESEDVTQDVFKRVAETIGKFEAQARRGSFRSWLMNLTRWRIADKFRDRLPESGQHIPRWEDSTLEYPDPLERLPANDTDDDAGWEKEWQYNVFETAMAKIARRVPAKHFQAFDLYARQRWPVMRVARELGINPATIYLISHRLTRQLKTEVTRLKTHLG